jgi:hypothetical protein
MSKHNPIQHKKKLLEALERTLGLITPACKECGLSRGIFYKYLRDDPEFKKAVDEIHEITLDFVEAQLFKQIKNGSERSILFYMKYRGRSRGYNETLNIDANIKIEQPLLKPFDDIDDIDDSDN